MSLNKLQAPAEVTIQAADATGPRRFKIVAYTGEPLRLRGYDAPVIIDLATADITAQNLPALYEHTADEHAIAGQIQAVRIEGASNTPPLVVEGIFTPRIAASDKPDYARHIPDRADAGYQWQASVGGDFGRMDRIEAGRNGTVNGRTYPGPAIIAREFHLREVSFTILGADRHTTVVVASDSLRASVMTFEEWLTSLGFDGDAQGALTEMQLINLKLIYTDSYEGADVATDSETAVVTAAAHTPAIQAAAEVKSIRDAAVAESTRIAEIRRIAASYGNPEIEVKEGTATRRVHLEAHALAGGLDSNATELLALRASRVSPAVNVGAGRKDNEGEIIEAALSITAGINPKRVAEGILSDRRERVMNEATGAKFRGFGLQAAMDNVLHASGTHYAGSRKSNDYIRTTLEAERKIQASGFTTISLSGLLGNVANKALLAGYEAVMTTWQKIAAVRSHSDFKVNTNYRLDSTGAFKKIGPDGELKHVGLAEASYTNQLGTYGAIIALTRQMMINDDLGAFLQIPTALGRMSSLRIEEAVYVLLLSNPSSFFASGNRNLTTGGSSVLSITSLTTVSQKFSDQIDSNGKPILIQPKILLVGTPLTVTANSLYREQNTMVTTTADTQRFTDNPHVGLYEPVASPYLSNTNIKDQDGAAITGQSSTAWYLFADPAVRAAIAVAFLNGQQTPTIESDEMPFTTLGMQWRGYHDFGVGMEDTAAAQKSNGA